MITRISFTAMLPLMTHHRHHPKTTAIWRIVKLEASLSLKSYAKLMTTLTRVFWQLGDASSEQWAPELVSKALLSKLKSSATVTPASAAKSFNQPERSC